VEPWRTAGRIQWTVVSKKQMTTSQMSMSTDRDRQWVSRVLGEAVIDVWAGLPQDVQQKLFEQAVLTRQGDNEENLRERLAKFLHDHHQRTSRHAHGTG
jgi:hypothetical protein